MSKKPGAVHLYGRLQRIDLRQVQVQQEAMMRHHTTVHCGDDVRAAGCQAYVGAIGQPLVTAPP